MSFSFTDMDFFKILQRIVAGWPAFNLDGKSVAWRQLQTFAVLSNQSDYEANNLNKTIQDKRAGTYYSRKWEEYDWKLDKNSFDYPLLAVYQYNFDLDNFASKKTRDRLSFELSLVGLTHNLPADNSTFDPCLHFTREEQASQLKKFAHKLSLELSDFIYIDKAVRDEIVVSGSFNESFNSSFNGATDVEEFKSAFLGWQSKRYMDQAVDRGLITRYNFTRRLKNYIVTQNSDGAIFDQAYRDGLAAALIRFELIFEYCPGQEINYDYTLNGERLV